MFVQLIEGRVADGEGLRRQFDRWGSELRPGASGYLGTTAGITEAGEFIAAARFESADDARANSGRPEQGEWWAQTERCFDGDVRFTDSSDVEMFLGGGSDDAGFVQVMKGGGADRAKMRAMDEAFAEHAGNFRPDLLGGVRLWTGDDTYVELAYFIDEEAARKGEQQEPPAELAASMAEFEDMMRGVEYIDLRDPWLT